MSCATQVRSTNGSARAFRAWEFVAEMFAAALRCGHPFAVGPGRVVTDVLLVAALEFGYPVVVLILVEADDFSWDGERHLSIRV